MMSTQPEVLRTRIMELLRADGPQTAQQVFAVLIEADAGLGYLAVVTTMRDMAETGALTFSDTTLIYTATRLD